MLGNQQIHISLKKYKNGKSYLSISIFKIEFYIIIQRLFTTAIKLITYIENQLKHNMEKNCGDCQNFIGLKNI